MEIKRKTNILIKTERKFVIHQPQSNERIWCEQCAEQMVTAQTAAVLYDTSLRAIYRLVEEGKIHFIETDSKVIFVCPNSAHSILPIDLD